MATTLPFQPIVGIRGFHVPMSCTDLPATTQFFIERLGFRIDAIFPADSPRTAILSRGNLTLRVAVGAPDGVTKLDVLCDDEMQLGESNRTLVAPNGVEIRLIAAEPKMKTPVNRQELVLSRVQDGAEWSVGRAGLRYRDLLPNRHGGAFIASHIRILEGGPVPDYVHFHKIRFQMIFCRKGWVRVVYEGQGEPFVLNAGDCVLQPPCIRHRVLESSAGAEVIEIGTPAEHITMADHDMTLPSSTLEPDREFDGQRFVRYEQARGSWSQWRMNGFVASDTGIGRATDGLAGVRLVRLEESAQVEQLQHESEFCFFFVLSGQLTVTQGANAYPLTADDSIAIPGGTPYGFADCSIDLELLEVTLPAELTLS
ncbi:MULTISPECIES: cupin domain-containing protein [unclassified Burkholderia]|uniref:cupin domain-containing protein n=1 Tax=unclassified Burkholderia TaxID=2613784 RepID=UPI000F5757F0|nr:MULTISPECIES: cupin domain-containing protein [unclassified Burkholderia]RQR69840.1 cupin domain-containing protein [Burkholderia sp. Bp9012]RQR73333.1 cupin domain-containing protein [Burkholderia sp. Bp9011]RQR85192.1 cupin domain-containing protein [Burkholderia sp. Bp9010]RQZ40316.1 cupin domain-containing protein [Burkholderia sp. Bp9099]